MAVDRFADILKEIQALHDKKGADYGSATDPYANVRSAAEFGVPAWVGALVRLNDKVTRLKSFIRNGKLANESVEDSLRDIQVYAIIAQVLYEEQNKPAWNPVEETQRSHTEVQPRQAETNYIPVRQYADADKRNKWNYDCGPTAKFPPMSEAAGGSVSERIVPKVK